MLVIAMMHVSKLALEGAEILIALSVGSFLVNCRFDASIVSHCTPSAAMLKSIMIDEAVETILMDQIEIQPKPLTILADKGDGQTKQGDANFVKLVARYNDNRNKVKVTLIRIQSAINTSSNAAGEVDHAPCLFDTDDHRFVLSNDGTDAGGGWTRMDFGLKLSEIGRVRNIEEYLASTCILHGINLTLASPTLLTMGEGALLRCNLGQVLHTAYNLSRQYGRDEWEQLWEKTTTNACEHIPCPVMTRWECVGDAAENVRGKMTDWKKMAHHIVQAEKTGTAKHTIASYLYSYFKEKMLIGHLHSLCAYIIVWWRLHFLWYKHMDEETKMPGFLAIHVPVHYFVQHTELEDIIQNWREKEEWAEYVSFFPTDNKINYMTDKLANDFFTYAKEGFHKHFVRCQTQHLHLMLARKAEPAMYLTCWLVDRPPVPFAPMYQSAKHCTTVHLPLMLTFLTEGLSPSTFSMKSFSDEH